MHAKQARHQRRTDPAHVDIMHLRGDIFEPDLDSSITSMRISSMDICALRLAAKGLRRLELRGPILLCDAEEFFENNPNLEYFRGSVARVGSFEDALKVFREDKSLGHFRMPPNQLTGGVIEFAIEIKNKKRHTYLRTDAEYVRGQETNDPWEILGITNPWNSRAKSARSATPI